MHTVVQHMKLKRNADLTLEVRWERSEDGTTWTQNPIASGTLTIRQEEGAATAIAEVAATIVGGEAVFHVPAATVAGYPALDGDGRYDAIVTDEDGNTERMVEGDVIDSRGISDVA